MLVTSAGFWASITFSEANGVFLIGDLTPGRFELHIDLTSVPKGYVAQPSSVIVTVTPAAVTRSVAFKLSVPPKRLTAQCRQRPWREA